MAQEGIRIVVKNVNDRQLQSAIVQMSRATGRTVKEETRTALKGMVRDALAYTPPASSSNTGKDAEKAGRAAIARDLRAMGFAPRVLKGHRTITMAFGHPIKPVTVPTKENPKFVDPDAFHDARLGSKHGGKVTRGGAQAFYVSKQKFNAMITRLFNEIGRLASGWVAAADELGVPVPAWIARHGGGRGTNVQVVEDENKITLRVVNHFPDNASGEAAEMIRRIAFLKTAAIGRLKRQLPYILGKNVRASKSR